MPEARGVQGGGPGRQVHVRLLLGQHGGHAAGCGCGTIARRLLLCGAAWWAALRRSRAAPPCGTGTLPAPVGAACAGTTGRSSSSWGRPLRSSPAVRGAKCLQIGITLLLLPLFLDSLATLQCFSPFAIACGRLTGKAARHLENSMGCRGLCRRLGTRSRHSRQNARMLCHLVDAWDREQFCDETSS